MTIDSPFISYSCAEYFLLFLLNFRVAIKTMINPIFTESLLFDDDDLVRIWSATDEELGQIEEYQKHALRSTRLVAQYGSTEPSVVLDDLLFLGNGTHGSNLKLLERFQISKSGCGQNSVVRSAGYL